jgi:hypothetical protein
MLKNATEAPDLILISSVSDIVTLDFEEAVVLEMELIFCSIVNLRLNADLILSISTWSSSTLARKMRGRLPHGAVQLKLYKLFSVMLRRKKMCSMCEGTPFVHSWEPRS